jgi:transcriptional regulator with XRE-family HTH domain
VLHTDHAITEESGSMVGEQSPSLYKTRLGAELRRLREAAGLERSNAADVLSCSVSKIRTIEEGTVAVRVPELRDLLDAYAVDPAERSDIEHLADLARQRRPRTDWGAAVPDRLRRFFDREETATRIVAYQPWLLHGLVQTEKYARAVISTNSSLTEQDVDRLVKARLARQSHLSAKTPPRLLSIIDEQALRKPIGGRDVMREQLAHLAALGRNGVAEVRVIPNEVGAHSACGMPFVILTANDGKRSAYVETLTDGLFVDDPERVARYEVTIREVLALALSPEDSLSLVDTVHAQL